jgi:GMP synthase-like glutamine amidotransferase
VERKKWVESVKKQLTEGQFQEAIKGLEVGQQTIEIAHGVLVEGKPQREFVKALDLSPGAVSQAVNRVWSVHEAKNLPHGYERVSAVLPEHQAFIVKRWAEDATRKREPKV